MQAVFPAEIVKPSPQESASQKPAFRCHQCNVRIIISNPSYLPPALLTHYRMLVKSHLLTRQKEFPLPKQTPLQQVKQLVDRLPVKNQASESRSKPPELSTRKSKEKPVKSFLQSLRSWIRTLRNTIKEWIRQWNGWINLPPTPTGAFVISTQELKGPNMSNLFRITVGCPPLASDEVDEVIKRRFRVSKLNDDGTVGEELKNEVIDMKTETALTRSFEARQDDKVKLELFNIDDAGNQSADSLSAEMTVLDTTAPNSPVGAFSITQEEIPDPNAGGGTGSGTGSSEGSGSGSGSGSASAPAEPGEPAPTIPDGSGSGEVNENPPLPGDSGDTSEIQSRRRR